MATYYARKSGNINAADVWATTPSGTASAVTLASGDVLVANSYTITINESTDLGSTGEVRNDTTGGATTGGSFSLTDGVTLTANVFARSASCVTGSSTISATVVGSLTGGSVTSGRAISWTSTGTLTVTAVNITAGSASDTNGIFMNNGTLSVTASGQITGGTNTNNPGIRIDSSSISHTITGNCVGGSSSGSYGVNLNSSGQVVITGNVTGAAAQGAFNANASGTIIVVGQAIAGATAPGITNNSTGSVIATRAVGNDYGPGNTAGRTAQPGIANVTVGSVTVEEIEYGTYGMSPTVGSGIKLKKLSSNIAKFNYCDTAGAKTLFDASSLTGYPAETDVRSGTSYASGALTGTCAVPAASSVAFGVPVDATTGTAFLSQSDVLAAVWGASTSSLTTAGSIGERLKNSATVATTGEQLATALTAP